MDFFCEEYFQKIREICAQRKQKNLIPKYLGALLAATIWQIFDDSGIFAPIILSFKRILFNVWRQQ